METLHANASLHHDDPNTFSLLSLNLLLPQKYEGWWIFKAYQHHIPMEQREWSYRHALLVDLLERAEASVLCLQEASALSFEEDFAFLEGGYERLLHRKFRFRCATFWRRDLFELVESHHGDRTLITTLRDRAGRLLHIVNCHLSGGPVPERRFRQVFDALERVRKISARHDDEETGVIVCGDMNSFPGETALERLLEGEIVGPEYRDPQAPERVISSKARRQIFGPMCDVSKKAYDGEHPATYVVTHLSDRFLNTEDDPTPAYLDALDRMFDLVAGGAEVLGEVEIDAWVQTINGEPRRGSEWRKAREAMGDAEVLTREQFRDVYLSEVLERKYWAVQHDLARYGLELSEGEPGPCAVCIDRVYVNASLEPVAYREALTQEQRTLVWERGDTLPNAWHPSDHLPVACRLRWHEG